MGGNASTGLSPLAAGKKGIERVGTVYRLGGENLNNLGFPEVTEVIYDKPTVKPHRVVICRCWQSLKFPMCDNSHQRLQKQGVHCGPLMLEIKAEPLAKKVGACPPEGCASASHQTAPAVPSNLGATAFLRGSVAAGFLAGAAHFSGMGPFPF
eukprot:TRINITY_DN16226_c0_g2_i1.p1 TRINITY_DN16226_c0_g2~~TRINITY_DN16226_c0_g2_i1.p1  ORF type:complete len:153 (+),score=12.27 TRINITY_DN16226_c0_g2_i1:99-557(+)